MHALETPTPTPNGFSSVSHVPATSYEPNLTFAPSQTVAEPRIGALVADRSARGEFFYGIEIIAQRNRRPTRVNFNDFLPVLPTFMSVVWLGSEYWNVQPIEQVHSVVLARHLEPRIPVLPHLAAYRLSEQRLDEFLQLNLSNVLAVRGDHVHPGQVYSYSHELVERARSVRGDCLSIGVAGYPEGYTNELNVTQNLATNMRHLKQKIESGAEYVITQCCFRPEIIVQFVRDCRAAHIHVPIVMGVMVPESYKQYMFIKDFISVELPPGSTEQLELLKDQPARVAEFFVKHALDSIQHVLDAGVGVHGVQFFTMSRFRSVLKVLEQLRERGILKPVPEREKE